MPTADITFSKLLQNPGEFVYIKNVNFFRQEKSAEDNPFRQNTPKPTPTRPQTGQPGNPDTVTEGARQSARISVI
ncbi:MAG: hypothetical protein WAV08_05040 [Desulfobacterales bacterium]